MSRDLPRSPVNESDVRQAIALDPRNAQAHYQLGLLLAESPGRESDAETAYRQAAELAPDNARYVYRLGLWLHEHSRHIEEAESMYRLAITLAPTDPFVYSGLVSLLMQQSRRAEASTVGAEMRALLMASANWYGLATLDSLLGNVNAAFDHLQKAVGEASFNPAWARNDPDLSALHDDLRFEEIVGKA